MVKLVDTLASGASGGKTPWRFESSSGHFIDKSQKTRYNSCSWRTWRNWYTRSLEEAVPQGMEVQLLSSAHLEIVGVGIWRLYLLEKVNVCPEENKTSNVSKNSCLPRSGGISSLSKNPTGTSRSHGPILTLVFFKR